MEPKLRAHVILTIPQNFITLITNRVNGKVDFLEGLKENVIVGHKIPAGTGLRQYNNLIVGSKEEYNSLLIDKEEEITF